MVVTSCNLAAGANDENGELSLFFDAARFWASPMKDNSMNGKQELWTVRKRTASIAKNSRFGTESEAADVDEGAPKAGGGWALVVAIVVIAVNLRPGIVSVGPILGLIQRQFGLSHTLASLLTAIPDLLMGLLALPTPWLARRFGRGNVLLFALVLLCLATAGRAFVDSTSALLVTTVGVGAGIAIAGSLFGGLIKSKFPTRAAMVMGIYATALSFGSTVSAAVTGLVAKTDGWRTAAGMWGLLGLLAIAGWWVIAKSDRASELGAGVSTGLPHRLPFGNRKAWLIAIFFACVNFLFYALLSWIAPMYQEYGLSTGQAGLVLASFTAIFMCSNPIIGSLSRRHDRRGWLILSAGLVAVGVIGMTLAPVASPVLWVGMCAFGLGGGFTLGMTLPLDNTQTTEQTNSWNAFVMLVGYVIAAAGPFSVGLGRDLTGGFRFPVAGLLAVSVVMLVIAPFLKPTRKSA
jgi:MFS transporter, CP family, cyanate transporter